MNDRRYRAIRAQEQILYNELVKYVELVSDEKTDFIGELEGFARKRPAFHITAIVKGESVPLMFTSHVLSPAVMRQDSLEPLDMTTVATFGRVSIAAALIGGRMQHIVRDVTDIALEIEQMKGGIGNA